MSPASPRLPVLVGGGGERRTMRIAARYADVWHTWAPPAEFRRKCEVLDRHCAEVGRDPADVLRVTGEVIRLRDSPTGPPPTDGEIVGTVEQVTDTLAEYARSGVAEFIVRDHRDTSVEVALETMATLAAEVFPRIAAASASDIGVGGAHT